MMIWIDPGRPVGTPGNYIVAPSPQQYQETLILLHETPMPPWGWKMIARISGLPSLEFKL
jgi:hypothetical protein